MHRRVSCCTGVYMRKARVVRTATAPLSMCAKQMWARVVFMHVSTCGNVVVPVSRRRCMSGGVTGRLWVPVSACVSACLHGVSP